MTERRSESNGGARRSRPEIFSALTAAAALFAPASLTGLPLVDALERALLVGFVSYVGAHGRRWTWLAGAAAVVISARGVSLALAVAGLAIVTGAAIPKRRRRSWGALGLGVMVNAVLWYPPSAAPWGVLLAVMAMALVVASGLRFLRRRERRVATRLLIGAVALVVVAGLGAAVAMGMAYRQVQTGATAARDALDRARGGDADAARADLETSGTAFETASTRISGPLTAPARLVPGLSQQVDAVRTTVDQGRRITATADDLVATADYDTLKYDGRLNLAQVRELAAPAARVNAVLDDAREELAELQDSWLVAPLQSRIDDFATDLDEARQDTALAAELLEVTPGLFGADEPRRYLIVFMTPAELRGSGGFIGSYAELEIDDGKATLSRSGRIRDLIFGPNQGNRTITGEPDYLRRYGRFHPEDFIQDATFSPDFPTSGSVLSQLYPQAGGKPVDGVIAVDPTGLAALLKLTGPVTVDGLAEPLTSENAVEVLTRSQYIDQPDDAQRGDILTEATRVTFERLIDASLPAPRAIADSLSPAVRSGHIRLWSPDENEQALFDRLGATGELAIPRGSDGLSVVQQNSGNNKLDAYLQRTITYLPTVDADTGDLRAELTIELTNNVPSLDLPPAVVGNARGLPPGTNLAWVTVFTPHRVTSAELDGSPITLGPSSEQGVNAWDAPLLQIPPGGTITLTVNLEGGVDLREGYRLTLLPQPVANPDRFTSTLAIEGGTVRATGRPEAELLDDEAITVPTRILVPLSG